MGRKGHWVRGAFQEAGQHVREMLQRVSQMNQGPDGAAIVAFQTGIHRLSGGT